MSDRGPPMRCPASSAASPRCSASNSRVSAPIRWSHTAASAMSGGSMRQHGAVGERRSDADVLDIEQIADRDVQQSP